MITRAGVLVAALLTALPAQAQAPAPAAAQPPTQDLLSQVDALYKTRDEPGVMDHIDSMLAEAEKSGPNYEVAWRKARNAFWRAETSSGDDTRARLSKQAWNVGEDAVKVDPTRGEAHYYAGISAGIYAESISVVKALMQGVESPFLEHMRMALTKVPQIDDGGPSLTMGRYHYSLPWPRYDGKESIRILNAVVTNHPGNLRARFYLAQTLLKEDQPALAKAQLDQIATLQPGRDVPEERLIKGRARAFTPEVEKQLR